VAWRNREQLPGCWCGMVMVREMLKAAGFIRIRHRMLRSAEHALHCAVLSQELLVPSCVVISSTAAQ
jgi:hypothetical protein